MPGAAGISGEVALNTADRWIVSRLHEVTAEVEAALKEYRFDLAAQALYSLLWNEYCDWYLELSKVVLTDAQASANTQRGTRRTLVQVLETLLRLLHPLMPFITEEIWQRVAPLAGRKGGDHHAPALPRDRPGKIDQALTEEMGWTMAVIGAIRTTSL